jgi:YVTN family beta-propeller protein
MGAGSTPCLLALNPKMTKLYVVKCGTGELASINTATLKVDNPSITTFLGATALSVDPSGKTILITTPANQIVMVDAATEHLIDSPFTGAGPTDIAASPTLPEAYVVNSQSHTLSTIDLNTHVIVDTLPTHDLWSGFAVSPDGRIGYTLANNRVQAVDLRFVRAGVPIASIKVGATPVRVITNSANTMAYVTNSADNTVSFVDLAANTVSYTAPVGIRPIFLALSPDEQTLYVSNATSGTVSLIHLADHSTITVPVGRTPAGIAPTGDGAFVFVANNGSNSISMLTGAGTHINEIATPGAAPLGLVATQFEGRVYLYATLGVSGGQSVIRAYLVGGTALTSVTPVFDIPLKTFPGDIKLGPDGDHLYVLNQDFKSVTKVSISGRSVETTFVYPSSQSRVDFAIDPSGTLIYASDSVAGGITAADDPAGSYFYFDAVLSSLTTPYGVYLH